MKKQIIAGIAVTACVALCAAVWPRSTEVKNLPVEPLITIVNAEIEARSEEMPKFLISANTTAPETEAVADSEPLDTDSRQTEKRSHCPCRSS